MDIPISRTATTWDSIHWYLYVKKLNFKTIFFFIIINKQKNSTFFYVLRGRNEPTIVTFIVDTLDWQVLQVAPEQFSREKRHNDAFAGSCHWVHSGLFYLQIYTAVYILIFCMSFITSLWVRQKLKTVL